MPSFVLGRQRKSQKSHTVVYKCTTPQDAANFAVFLAILIALLTCNGATVKILSLPFILSSSPKDLLNWTFESLLC